MRNQLGQADNFIRKQTLRKMGWQIKRVKERMFSQASKSRENMLGKGQAQRETCLRDTQSKEKKESKRER